MRMHLAAPLLYVTLVALSHKVRVRFAVCPLFIQFFTTSTAFCLSGLGLIYCLVGNLNKLRTFLESHLIIETLPVLKRRRLQLNHC